jgi:menaquinone-dependent protoporphyrinogen oxidase
VRVVAVLVGFATSGGSSRGVAERLASRLSADGIAAETRPVSEVPGVAGYDAVVLGSAIHGGKWLPEASRFARKNAAALRQRPTWLFSVSTVGDQESMFPPLVARCLRALRKETAEMAALRGMVQAREHRNFAGVIGRTDWPMLGRAFFRTMGGRYGDHRNWPAIDAWADSIAAALTTRSPIGSDGTRG